MESIEQYVITADQFHGNLIFDCIMPQSMLMFMKKYFFFLEGKNFLSLFVPSFCFALQFIIKYSRYRVLVFQTQVNFLTEPWDTIVAQTGLIPCYRSCVRHLYISVPMGQTILAKLIATGCGVLEIYIPTLIDSYIQFVIMIQYDKEKTTDEQLCRVK